MPLPGEFTIGDIGLIIGIPGTDLLTPSVVWKRRGADMPDKVTVGTTEYPLKDLDMEDYSREFWFDYFRKESFSKWQSAGKDKQFLLNFFNKAFVKPDSFRADTDYTRYLIPRGQFDKVFVTEADDKILREALEVMLKLGFSSIESGASGNAVVSNQALANRVSSVDKKKADTFKLVWRGSERTWENVRQYGNSAAARFDPDAIKWNMRERWHPLSVFATRNRIHFRNNQNDNCLFTTVSVTDDWKCALCYPKIEQNSDLINICKGVAAGKSLEAQYKTAPPGRIGKVTYSSSSVVKVEYRMVSITRIAVLVLDGLVLDTGGAQNDWKEGCKYPEYGLHSVAGTNVFGMKEFIRLFHGTSDDEGFTAYYSPGGTRLATQAEVLAAFGDVKAAVDYYPKIVNAVNEAKLNRVALKWVATGTGDPGKTLDYWQKIEFANGQRLTR